MNLKTNNVMDNSVRDYRGDIIGYKCWTCEKISQSMWGETCNECRNKKQQDNNLIDEIRKLREELEQFKTKN